MTGEKHRVGFFETEDHVVGGRCDRREARSRRGEEEDHDGGWSL